MNSIKLIVSVILYGIVLGIIPVSLNYIYDEFDVPKELSIPVIIALLLLTTAIVKWQKLPKDKLIGLAIFIGCSIGYSVVVAIDYYIVDYFEPNIYWVAIVYLPVFFYVVKKAKEEDRNS